ncbi:intracellular protein transport protein USO1 [Asbolus verrucosus]|uniref:Intracellular protein transport protein USO1 n=1 Tax=Asbolus verrucosus TaxID=1661398 RepID=A0A482W0N8_ASBVE|nr:intracellular protein transport protein USO1 [Asbolus verrucosus]
MTALQEIVPNPEHEVQEVDGNSQEDPCETTKELFRRNESPRKDEIPVLTTTPKSSKTPNSSPKTGTPIDRPVIKQSTMSKKDDATKKKSNSGIPLRLKSAGNPAARTKTGTYRHSTMTSNLGSVINRNTLEVQFINNKKRLLQLHAELLDKQRPLVDMHKSLLRTKKQLEDLGKKVVLEDLKIISLKTGDNKMDGAGENPVAETAMTLKSSLDNVLDTCVKVCKKCFVKRDHVVKVLENMSKSLSDPSIFESELDELKREKGELEKFIENTVKENGKKIEELITDWQKTVKTKALTDEVISKIDELEETVRQQQKAISDAEDNLHSITRKFEDKKNTYEKTIAEMHDKTNKLEEELKKEKKTANDNLMKSRNLRSKVTELEIKTKEAEEKNHESSKKLAQLQDQIRKKEIQWLKEKDDFKKNEALLQQKFTEKQSQFDTRCLINITLKALNELIMPSVLKDMEHMQKTAEKQQQNFYRTVETQLEIKEQELMLLDKEKEVLAEKSARLEEQLEEMKKQVEAKDREIDQLSIKAESVPAIEYRPNENQWMEVVEYKQKLIEVQNTIKQQSDQISKMQSSLKAHAQLAAALKLEKDNAVKYSAKLRDILQEARDEIEYKNRTIYKIHEKLMLKEKACEKLKTELNEYETSADFVGDRWNKNRCQICMSSLSGEKYTECSSCLGAEVGKSSSSSPQYVSESLIGMSVKKVDHLRARLDNLKKMKLPIYPGKKQFNIDYSWSNQSCQNKAVSNSLHKQIELRGKLYQILQKHADQSCEDFINLLKLTVSNGAKGSSDNELKPSNMTHKTDDTVNSRFAPRHFSSKIKITKSYNTISQFNAPPFNQIYDKLNESLMLNDDDVSF